jgi:hypothetical protein
MHGSAAFGRPSFLVRLDCVILAWLLLLMAIGALSGASERIHEAPAATSPYADLIEQHGRSSMTKFEVAQDVLADDSPHFSVQFREGAAVVKVYRASSRERAREVADELNAVLADAHRRGRHAAPA